MTAVRCDACAHWKRRLPRISDARLDPSCPLDMGGCTARAPEQFLVNGAVCGFWPRTREDYGCGEFIPIGGGDPDDGERRPVPGNVVPISAVAA